MDANLFNKIELKIGRIELIKPLKISGDEPNVPFQPISSDAPNYSIVSSAEAKDSG